MKFYYRSNFDSVMDSSEVILKVVSFFTLSYFVEVSSLSFLWRNKVGFIRIILKI